MDEDYDGTPTLISRNLETGNARGKDGHVSIIVRVVLLTEILDKYGKSTPFVVRMRV